MYFNEEKERVPFAKRLEECHIVQMELFFKKNGKERRGRIEKTSIT